VARTTGRGYVAVGGALALAQTVCPDDLEIQSKMAS